MTTLILLEAREESLQAARRLLAVTAMLGPATLLFFGHGPMVEAAARLPGVEKVFFTTLSPGRVWFSFASWVNGFSHCLALANAMGREVIPRLAAMLDAPLVTGVVAVEGKNRFLRSAHADCVRQRVECQGQPLFLTVRATAFAGLEGEGTRLAPVAPLEFSPSPVATHPPIFRPSPVQGPSLERAKRVVTAGGGCGPQGYALVEKLATRLAGAVGATRAAVEAGFAPEERQIGQTGRIIAPELYVAVGVSGSLQHLAGVKDAGVIVAINHDPCAPILGVADYAWVADLHRAVPELIALLESHKGGEPQPG